jgi:hypothetical protein
MAQQQGATLTQAPQQIKVPCSFFTDLSAYLNSEVQVLGKASVYMKGSSMYL